MPSYVGSACSPGVLRTCAPNLPAGTRERIDLHNFFAHFDQRDSLFQRRSHGNTPMVCKEQQIAVRDRLLDAVRNCGRARLSVGQAGNILKKKPKGGGAAQTD